MISRKKVAEYRTIPLNQEKTLEEERVNLILEMEQIVKKSKETRTVSDTDKQRVEEIKIQIQGIDETLKLIEEQRAFNNNIPAKIGEGAVEEPKEARILKGTTYPDEKLEQRAYPDDVNLDLGKLVKGMSGLGWNGANEERKYYRTMETGGNKVTIPQRLADRIVDYARANSALFGKIPVVSMPNNNLTIAVQTKDGEAKFVKEGDLIPNTDVAFKGVTLEGKTLALFVPISEQLLETASNLGNQLMTSCARAIAVALDKALLYGEGVVIEEEVIKKSEIKGVTKYESINKVTCDTVDFDLIIKGAKAIKKANLIPTDVCLNSDLASDLSMLKTTDGQYVVPPKTLENYDIAESNNINDNEAVVFDRNSILLGLQKGMTIEWGTSGDMFQRIQKGLRIVLRADLGVINEKGITLVTVTQ